jgi:FkbH-like protein
MPLSWLPQREDWDALLKAAKLSPPSDGGPLLRQLAESRMEFAQVLRLDRVMLQLAPAAKSPTGLTTLRLALLSSSTTAHLAPGIRVAGLRYGLQLELFECDYASYRQQLMDTASALHAFRPDAVLFAFDARHLAAAEGTSAESALELMRSCWRQARLSFPCQVLQQTVLPVFPALLGNNEHRLPESPATIVAELNSSLRQAAIENGVDLLALDTLAAAEGLAHWHDAALWLHAKQEVHPRAAEMYGEQVARLIAAGLGRSRKCLVLDLDNTLWGGVVGDDGVEGIVLGQGSAAGEAFVEFQRYAKRLSERGVLLAVCSKNDRANAVEPFERHPEMDLQLTDIACFVANWTDKAANLREIARQLNIGLDALVFVDDNPVERDLVRRELPMVAVPEMPEDPADFAATISAAGYFEALRVTREDQIRCSMYQANSEREAARESTTDLSSYLESLHMHLAIAPFDDISLPRVTQLIHKTNQFNLTTLRLSEAEVRTIAADPAFVTLQARLKDRFGDNGIIAVLIARIQGPGAQGAEAVIEHFLMSCRVFGRRVEEACLNALVQACQARGVMRLTGIYRETEKNAMVRELYASLGFSLSVTEACGDPSAETMWSLPLADYKPRTVPMDVEVQDAAQLDAVQRATQLREALV